MCKNECCENHQDYIVNLLDLLSKANEKIDILESCNKEMNYLIETGREYSRCMFNINKDLKQKLEAKDKDIISFLWEKFSLNDSQSAKLDLLDYLSSWYDKHFKK